MTTRHQLRSVPAPPEPRAAAFTVRFRLYVLVLLAGALAILPAGIAAMVAKPLETVVWVVFLAAGNLITIPVLRRDRLHASLGGPIGISSASLLSPPLALFINLVALAGPPELRRGTSPWLIVFNHCQFGLSAYVASAVATLISVDGSPGLLLRTAGAAAVYNMASWTAVTLSMTLRGRTGPDTAVERGGFMQFLVDFALVGLLALLIVIAYQTVGVVAVLLTALPLLLGYDALRSARVAEDRAIELADRVRDLETLNQLGGELLTARQPAEVRRIGTTALRRALGVAAAAVVDRPDAVHGRAVSVPRCEEAVVDVPADTDDRSLAVVEAVAGLLGLALQRVELEHELASVQLAREDLTAQLLAEGARERIRIALEIHDDVLPYLAAAEIQADNVRSALTTADPGRADGLAAATRDAVHGAIGRLRAVLEALRRQTVTPGQLRENLSASLEALRVTHGLAGRLRAPDPLPPLPLAVELLVLDTVRGCLSNVVRHAQARTVEVVIDCSSERVSVQVCDDGLGFDPNVVEEGHHGLALMAQRVALARGALRVDSGGARTGTRVDMEVPL